MLELVDSYTWPNDGFPFAGLGLRMDDLASRLGVAVHTWHVDGLGPARGLGFVPHRVAYICCRNWKWPYDTKALQAQRCTPMRPS
jgi:hypothetical protein